MKLCLNRFLSSPEAKLIDRFATDALIEEVRLYPKAGLVSLFDTGSHSDMDARTFFQSAYALEGYFAEIAVAGAKGAVFSDLQRIGWLAEVRMFEATGGINTHRGAIFSLGLLAAAAGICIAESQCSSALNLCHIVAERWGRAILASAPLADTTHGAQVRKKYGVPGARDEAAAGFPTATLHCLPAYRKAFSISCRETAALHAFYAGMAILEDNNLLYRAGPDALNEAKLLANEFLQAGGLLAPDGFQRACAMHRVFSARRWSPGGSADLLILTLFLTRFETHFTHGS
jgi:triphosphoribosyl-dephospho-CoA synthase